MAESKKKPDAAPKVENVFDLDLLRRLVELMKEHNLGEVDLQQDDQRIRLCGSAPGYSMAPVAMPQPVSQATASPLPVPATETDGAHITVIKSPMVGTFYSKPNPTSKDFVEVGSTVQNDTVVCIIEAMKVFNEIPAEMRGKVVQVLVRNEEAVDVGKPLFKIDTRG
ncbi:MAG: acetyl-CoA carboxylase biotin carboxyl carrier protein [Pirellula sp.]|jgi:acetyl-CoA carboxylase biotin carboxyl carrier protein